MTSPFNAIATALYNILKADAPLVAALGGTAANRFKIYHIIASLHILFYAPGMASAAVPWKS